MTMQYNYRVESKGFCKEYFTLMEANHVANWRIHFGATFVSITRI